MPTINLVDQVGVVINAEMAALQVSGINSVISANSIKGDGTPVNPLMLFNDTVFPAPSQYYGTDDGDALGWHNLPGIAQGDMQKSIYDVNNDGIVDQAASALSVDWSVVTNPPVIPTVGHLFTSGSVTGGGIMTTDQTVSLVNDVPVPDADTFYGYRNGARGFYSVPYSTLSGRPVLPTVGTLTPIYSIQGGGSMSENIGISLVGDLVIPPTNTFYGYVGGVRGFHQIAYALIPDPPTIPTTGTLTTINSLSGGGPISSNLTLSLVGDNGAPGADTYYGMHGGAKGFYQIPYASLGGLPSIPTVGTLTTNDSLTGGAAMTGNLTVHLVNDTATPTNGQFYGYSGDARGWFTPPIFGDAINGYVPASGGGTALFLRADHTWAEPPGSGGTTYMTTFSTFAIPALFATVVVTVATSVDMAVGQVHVLTDGTLSMIGAITTIVGPLVTYRNQGGPGAVTGTMGAGHVYMSGAIPIDNTVGHYLSGTNTWQAIPTVGTMTTDGSLTGGAAMTGNLTVHLVNDNATPAADTFYGYHGSAKGFFQVPYASLGGLPTIPTVGTLTTAGSFTGGAAMTGNLTLNLVNDNATPAANTFYGYVGSAKGFFAVPYAGLSGAPSIPTVGTLTTSDSITGGGAMTGNLTVTLVGDVATPSADTYYGYHGGARGFFQIPYSSLASPPSIPTVGTLTTDDSLTGGGAMTGNLTVHLVGDTLTPGNSKLYGTNSSGTKGWYDQPTGGAAGTLTTDDSLTGGGSMTGNLTVHLVNDTLTPTNGQFYGYNASARGWSTPPTATATVPGYVAPPNNTYQFYRADATWKTPALTYGTFFAQDNIVYSTTYPAFITRGAYGLPVLDCKQSVTTDCVFMGFVPLGGNLVSGLSADIIWSSHVATTGNVKWNVAFARLNSTSSIASTAWQTLATATTATAGTIDTLVKTTIAGVTNLNSLAAGEPFLIKVTRDGTNGADTMTTDIAEILSVHVYSAGT